MAKENITIENSRLREMRVSITANGDVRVAGFDNLNTAISDLEYALNYLQIRKQIAIEHEFK